MKDWGSRDTEFIALTDFVMHEITQVCESAGRVTTVPLQGSGTYAVEAMLTTFVGPQDRLLILINGAYGERIEKICSRSSITHTSYTQSETKPIDAGKVRQILESDKDITHVAVVYVETTTGILNPIDEVAHMCRTLKKRLLIDAMSAFGALPTRWNDLRFCALAASSNKCLEGPPGIGFVICDKQILSSLSHQVSSLVLDIKDQWQGFQKNGQWRFTPPTQVVAGLAEALRLFNAEGRVNARGDRYWKNCHALRTGLVDLGFDLPIADNEQAPIIVTVAEPDHPNFEFDVFYRLLNKSGYVIYPGKLAQVDSFRIGCIGQVFPDDIARLLDVIDAVLTKMDVNLK